MLLKFFFLPISCLIILVTILIIALVDIQTRKIPNRLILLLLGVSLLQHLVLWDIPRAAAGALLSLAMYGLVHFTNRAKFGLGDVKLGVVLGFVLGYPAVLLSLLVVGVLSLLGVSASKLGLLKNKIPFAPFIAVGALVAMVWGDWFVRLLLER